MRLRSVAGWVAGVVVAGFVFQVFLRYGYTQNGPYLLRIDRLTQQTCVADLPPNSILAYEVRQQAPDALHLRLCDGVSL